MNHAMVIAILLIIGHSIGLTAGFLEAGERKRRIDVRDRRKLPHGKLLAIRMGASLLPPFIITHHMGWQELVMAGILFLACTITHRIMFNLRSEQPFYYMGSPHRTKGDSIYDTIMWLVPIHVWNALCRITGRSLSTFHASVPFILANTIELTALYFLIRSLP